MNFYCYRKRDVRLLSIAISLLLLNFPIWWDINDIHAALGYSTKGGGDNCLRHAVDVLQEGGVLELQGGQTVNTQPKVVRLSQAYMLISPFPVPEEARVAPKGGTFLQLSSLFWGGSP